VYFINQNFPIIENKILHLANLWTRRLVIAYGVIHYLESTYFYGYFYFWNKSHKQNILLNIKYYLLYVGSIIIYILIASYPKAALICFFPLCHVCAECELIHSALLTSRSKHCFFLNWIIHSTIFTPWSDSVKKNSNFFIVFYSKN